jgi:6-phosphogluconolactonase (cycloisomerase 2 family)
MVSNRNDKSVTTANGQSDSLVTFAPQADGSLQFIQIAAAGGSTPRHFSFNKAGDLIAVGLQGNSLVVILERDVATGAIGEVLAQVSAGTSPACVLWDE